MRVSKQTTPSAKMSESADAGFISICSGDMYIRVPLCPMVECVSAMWAMPKSMIFTESSFMTKMLLGFRSR